MVSQEDLNCNDFHVVLSAKLTRLETDNTDDFLLRPQEHELGAVSLTSMTYFHVTGAERSISVLALGQNQPIELALPNVKLIANAKEGEAGSSGVVTLAVPADTRVNITCSQKVLAIDGTVCSAMNGQASVLLKDLMDLTSKGNAYCVAAKYCGWKAMASTLTFSNVSVNVHPCLKKTLKTEFTGIKLTFEENSAKMNAMEAAFRLLESLYDQSAQTRTEIVFKPAPNLTKPVMSVPFGINGSRFDLSAAVCDRPQSFTDEALESMLMGGIKSVCGFECQKDKKYNDIVESFIKETESPSIHLASRWAVVAGDALSATNAVICPYRVDGRSVLLPTGADLLTSESWYAEAHRSTGFADDCEGSASLIVSIVNRTLEVARDSNLSKKFPILRGIGNALRHHVVGVTVMSANAGNADASGEDHSAVAGHAACFAISKPAFATAIKKGFECKLRDQGRDKVDIRKTSNALVSEVWTALYADDHLDLPSTPNDEKSFTSSSAESVSEKILNMEDAASKIPPVFEHVAAGPLTALGLEGTAAVSPTILYSDKKDDRVARQHYTRNDIRINEALKQNVARNISVIDVDPNDHDKNKFYKSIVEFILPTSSQMCKSEKLRTLSFASPHFVLSQTSCSDAAGCSPKEIGLGDFKLTPLYTLNSEQGALFDMARADVAANTMPMQAEKDTLTSDEAKMLALNIKNLKGLAQQLTITDSDRTHTARRLITLASLKTEGGLSAFMDSLKKKKGLIGVTVNSHRLENVLYDDTGEETGEFMCVNITARVN